MSFLYLPKPLLPNELPLQDVEYYHLARTATEDDYAKRKWVQNLDDINDFKRWLGESRGRTVLAFDTETTGLDIYSPTFKVRLAQFGTENECWSINCERWPGIVQEVLETYDDTPMVAHNISYDAKATMLAWSGFDFPWHKFHDTMIYLRINDNEARAGLKSVAGQLWGTDATYGEDMLKASMQANDWTWATIPYSAPAYTAYAGMDTILTARLYNRLDHIRNSYIGQLEMDTVRIACQMEMRGMRADREYLASRRRQLYDYIEALDERFEKHLHLNPRSNRQLASHFVAEGFAMTELTGSGQYKMDKDVLNGLAAQGSDAAEMILNMRKAQKLASTYFDNLLKFSDNADHIVHPSINTIEAATSRMSVSQPSMQNLPKNDKTVRRAFIPHEGEKLVTCDYSQIEMRLTAHISGDTALQKAFVDADRTGEDFFTNIGKAIYGKGFEKSDPRRTLIKNVMYGSAYGAGVPKMATSAKVPLSVMQPIADDLFARFHGIRGIMNLATDYAERKQADHGRPYITDLYGRRLYVNRDKIYTAANYLVQGTAADELKRALVRLDYADLTQFALLCVHDEVVFSIPENLIPEVSPKIEEAMAITTSMGYTIDIPAEPEGPFDRWSKD